MCEYSGDCMTEPLFCVTSSLGSDLLVVVCLSQVFSLPLSFSFCSLSIFFGVCCENTGHTCSLRAQHVVSQFTPSQHVVSQFTPSQHVSLLTPSRHVVSLLTPSWRVVSQLTPSRRVVSQFTMLCGLESTHCQCTFNACSKLYCVCISPTNPPNKDHSEKHLPCLPQLTHCYKNVRHNSYLVCLIWHTVIRMLDTYLVCLIWHTVIRMLDTYLVCLIWHTVIRMLDTTLTLSASFDTLL